MDHDGFRYEFTPSEMKYFLFGKKRCPKCGGKMEKSKGYETCTGADVNSRADAFFVSHSKIKKYMYFYTCQDCGMKYSLKELAGGKEG